MGRPPAYLFVVRHGYRLDAADKQWHLSSPAPYDSPLTYSGWQQAKNTGARIASILRERIKEDEPTERQDPSRKKKQYKVVLHTSPYLRCLQTSIAICAGLAQDSTPFGPIDWDPRPPTPPFTASGRPRPPTIVTDVQESVPATPGSNDPSRIRKSVLRVDAFLGEWLSPTYFELITPPPESVMMLANAKIELMRNEDYTHYSGFGHHAHSSSQSQLWSPVGRPSTPAFPPPDDASEPTGSSSVLRTPSVSSQSSQSSQNQQPAMPKSEATGYVSPVPHYAISNHNTIPPGYVSHAKNFCVALDWTWDSMRPPLNWGDGGSYPEDWTDMHKRFRAGLQRLVDWYSMTEGPTEILSRSVNAPPRKDSDKSGVEEADEVETEAVVVLVSHGAGCNALIGAITHQPALVDVLQTSITMAARKSDPKKSSVAGSATGTPAVHELYDLVLNNNNDHLRSPPSTPASSRSASVASVLNSVRGRHLSFSGTANNISWNDNNSSRGSSANVALSGLRKVSPNNAPANSSRLSFAVSKGGITVGSGVTSFTPAKTTTFGHRSSIGLWSPTSERAEDEDEDNMLLNFGDEKKETSSVTPRPIPSASPSLFPPVDDMGSLSVSPGTITSSVTTPKGESDQLGDGPGGLWGGGPRPPEDADRLRDFSSTKRRWTVTERGS